VPSQAERDEVHRVQGLQVRTNAAGMATNLLAQALGRTVNGVTEGRPESGLLRTTPDALLRAWYVLAHGIEEYIVGGVLADAPVAHVDTRA
jgi:hypothetical protein